MKSIAFSFSTILISMLLLDGLWLGIMLKRFYVPSIGHLLSPSINFTPALVFYILFAIALQVFVVGPALRNQYEFFHILLLGMLFGLATYGTYDLTNYATLKDWPFAFTAIDMAWGSCLAALCSLIATYTTRYLLSM